ncbi:MAG TPA: hypothetical protein VGL56_09635 [Fimbriimonadaceae bacterium]|jgi:hypothetical protein
MRLSWQMTVATILSVGIILGLFHEVRILKPDLGEDPRVSEYLQQIQPVEKELEDVRHNLFEISKGVPVHEAISHVEQDANRESAALTAIRSVPPKMAATQGQFVAWAHILQGSVHLAKGQSSQGMHRQLAENVSKADDIYRNIEIKVAPEER